MILHSNRTQLEEMKLKKKTFNKNTNPNCGRDYEVCSLKGKQLSKKTAKQFLWFNKCFLKEFCIWVYFTFCFLGFFCLFL